MKYKVPILLLLSFGSTLFSQLDMIRLFGVGPANQIIKNGTTTITESGSYHVIENITSDITVNADNVFIDIKGFTVSASATQSSVFKISEGRENIVIQNGSIFGNDQLQAGILVEDSARNIVLQNLNMANCSAGIYFSGADTKEIACCKVTNCYVADSLIGFDIEYANNCVFEDCQSCGCQESGFDLFKCKYNKIKTCKAIRIGSSTPALSVAGFSAISGQDNLFFECMAEGIYKTSSEFGGDAVGFKFGSTGSDPGETESKIINCLVDSISNVTGEVNLGNAYGIQLESVFMSSLLSDPNSGCPAIVGNFEDSIADIAWSPLGDKIAVVFSGEDLGAGAGPVKVFDFNCNRWHEVFDNTLTDNDKRHIEWDPTGRYLSIGTLTGSDNEVVVYDTLYRISYGVSLDLDVSDPVWSRDGRYVVYMVNYTTCTVFEVGNASLTPPVTAVGAGHTNLVNPDISPDELYFATGSNADGTLYVYNWTNYLPFLGTEITNVSTSLLTINDLEWCPIACDGNYYVAVVGTGNTSNIEVYEFNNSALTSKGTALFGDTVLKIKWAPNGKYFAVFATNGTVGVYSFDPSATQVISLVYSKSLGKQVSEGGLDWSPSGDFLMFGGGDGLVVPNFNIVQVGIAPTKCVVYNNKIANVSGYIGGLGIFGSSDCNSILKNICYESTLNFSKKVLDVWYRGIVAIDQLHYNVSIPPY